MLHSMVSCTTLVAVLCICNSLMAFLMKINKESLSSFECGFDCMNKPRVPISIQFFLLLLIFLVFDIEIAFILHSPIIMNNLNKNLLFTLLLTFIFMLIIGATHEWNQGSLNWKL